MKRMVSILLWSAISAAFIGPGTVTTAAKGGAEFGYTLLWALVFSVIACLSLQEASARLTIATGKPLARAMREQFSGSRAGRLVPAAVVGAVVLGCAAYQAGNILGAVEGAVLGLSLHPVLVTLAIGMAAAAFLFAGSAAAVARLLGLVVALMGISFLVCAIKLGPDIQAAFKGSVIPSLPMGSGTLALGLIGTTVVPYNLFLGSGLARGERLSDARFGLAVAIPLGGLISMGILVVGTSIEGPFSFPALAEVLGNRLGPWAGYLFAFGLFAAGLSSAVTAPMAAALSIRGFVEREGEGKWEERSFRYRAVWIGVLAFGLGFGLTRVAPIPAIIFAQALNGVILPLVALFLWIAVNDRKLMGREGLCGPVANLFLGFSVLVALVLGARGILSASFSALGLAKPGEGWLLGCAGAFAVVLAYPIFRAIRRRRS